MLLNRLMLHRQLVYIGICLLISPIYADEKYADIYPNQVTPCFSARDTFGDERNYAELTGITERDDSCVITVMFKDEENLALFNRERESRELDPDSISFRGKTYLIEKSF